jgi:tRNA uridine 5-carbamoylmethylation protein Kti12
MENEKTTLVLMAGLPGAGKSTLSSALGRTLNWYVIDKDKDKEVLMQQGMEEEHAGRAAYELAFETVRRLLIKQRASVILDSSSLYSFILENAQDIVRSVPNVQLKVILCVAGKYLRDERLRNRPYQITRIRVDPATIIDYLQLFNHLPEDKLIIYTTVPLEKCLSLAIDYLTSEDQNLS